MFIREGVGDLEWFALKLLELKTALREGCRTVQMRSNNYSESSGVVPPGVLLVKGRRVIYADHTACDLLSRGSQGLEELDLAELFHHDDRPTILKTIQEAERGARPADRHMCRLIRVDGSTWSAEMEVAPLGVEEPFTLLILLRDVARQRQVEQRLRQVQRMEALGQLAAGIAHDFNNLLGAMANYLTLIRGRTRPGGQLGDYLNEIGGLVERGKGLVRQILSGSREGVVEVSVHDLHEVIRPVVRMLRHTLPKGVMIQLEEGDMPPFLMDAGQLQQVIMNLCINASDAMPEGGDIRIRTDRGQVTRESAHGMPGVEQGTYAVITVSDSGVGMSPEITRRIFEPFFSTKAVGEGSGLGLSICSALVRGHGGFIEVESEPGRGTTVSVYLPLREGAPAKETSPLPETPGGEETILLVDDEATMLESTALLLRDLGYRTLTACGGQEAVEAFNESAREIQLVLMDLGMPGMDGAQTFRRIREIDPGVRALLLTGLPQSDEALKAVSEGFVGVIQKPFRIEDLSQKIRKALETT